MANPDPRAAAEVYYDGGCPVCRREIGMYRGMTGADQVSWVDVSTAPPPPGHSREALLNRFTVRRRDGRTATGARGFVALWRALPRTRAIGVAFDRWPFLPLGEFAYRLFLRLRRLWRPGPARAGS